MASPVITLHDGAGAEITGSLALPDATPGTPTAETVFSVRNNDAGGGAVDPLLNGKLTILARLAGSSANPTADGLRYLTDRAAQIRVSAVSGGATTPITGWRPLGTGRALNLATVPDGAVVTCGIRTDASLPASLADVELFISVEGIQTTALPDGVYESFGNFIYDGRPGGLPDLSFSSVFSFIGALAPDSPNDDSVDTWSAIEYALLGSWYTFAPATPEVVFTNLDGDAAALASGEAYYAGLTLDGTGTLNVPKGPKNTAPLTDADKPTPPADELLVGWVVVPFGLVIDTVESVLQLEFFGYQVVSGLQISVGPGQAAVGGRWISTQTPTTVTLADASTLDMYLTPAGGLEVVTTGVGATDGQSMLIWTFTTAGAAVTGVVDHRRTGSGYGRHPHLALSTGATYNVTAGDHVVFADTDSAAVTVQLPAGTPRRAVRVVNVGTSSNQASVTPAGSELLLGISSAFALNDGESLELVYDPTKGWY